MLLVAGHRQAGTRPGARTAQKPGFGPIRKISFEGSLSQLEERGGPYSHPKYHMPPPIRRQHPQKIHAPGHKRGPPIGNPAPGHVLMWTAHRKFRSKSKCALLLWLLASRSSSLLGAHREAAGRAHGARADGAQAFRHAHPRQREPWSHEHSSLAHPASTPGHDAHTPGDCARVNPDAIFGLGPCDDVRVLPRARGVHACMGKGALSAGCFLHRAFALLELAAARWDVQRQGRAEVL